MKSKIRLLAICLGVNGLSACTSYHPHYDPRYPSYQPYSYEKARFYSQSYYSGAANYSEFYKQQDEASVPDSYYVGASRSPTSHKALDSHWVKGQNPKAYTIEIADDEKASLVAGKLYKAPKKDRMAEINYQRDGKSYYKGVYGSYNNYEDAQKAFNNLPVEIKQGAGIKNWSSIQSNIVD